MPVRAAKPVEDRRSAPREPMMERASVIFDSGSVRACYILDFSHRGARLELEAPNQLPQRFELLFPTGHRVKAVVVWQRELLAGVAFRMPVSALDRLAGP
jgi:hypothetical protein